MASAQNTVQIKVCGLTRAVDVETCETLGIEWAGFNFWPKSKRYIAPEAARPLVASLKNTKPVGVFVNPTVDEVRHAVDVAGIRYAQLHGDEPWSLIASMPVPVIKALPADRLHDLQGLAADLLADLAVHQGGAASLPDFAAHQGGELPLKPGRIAYLLVDTPAGPAYGGTGQPFDWSALAPVPSVQTATQRALPLPFFLAGGLGPENVAAAVATVHPMAVDLNSKVESAPGIKDRKLLEACLRELGRSV
jgi:phosphoribosylanthranilate isomerase